MIARGESDTLDFKQTISDASKIAKTLVAFANHKGGTLLIGVRDNGRITGCNPEDERYMIEYAAESFCSPRPEIIFREHEVENRQVLEVHVGEGREKPYFARDEQGKWWVYHRVNDESLQASAVMFQVLKKQNREKSHPESYSYLEAEILKTLGKEHDLTLPDLMKNLDIKRNRVVYSLAKLIHFDLVEVHYGNKMEMYALKS